MSFSIDLYHLSSNCIMQIAKWIQVRSQVHNDITAMTQNDTSDIIYVIYVIMINCI